VFDTFALFVFWMSNKFLDKILSWSTFWDFWLSATWAFSTTSVSASFDVPITRPDSSGTTFPWEVSEGETLWEAVVSFVPSNETSWWSFRKFFASLSSIASRNGFNFTVNEFFFTLAPLAFFTWVLPVVLIDFVNFASFDASFSDFDDMAFASPGLATTRLDEFSFADFAWVISWAGTSWGVTDFAALWYWWASALVFVTAWIFWMWSLDLFNFTLSKVTLDFFHKFTANIRFARVATLFWFTSKRIVASSFGFAKNLSSGITSWWTWSSDLFGVDRTNTSFFDAVVDSAVMFPWFATWKISVTEMFTFAWWIRASVCLATESWFSWDGVDNSVSSAAKFYGEWFFWASWWADTLFLHAHARISDWTSSLSTDVLLSFFVEIAGVVNSGSYFIVFAD
jgi:hypothetical protein